MASRRRNKPLLSHHHALFCCPPLPPSLLSVNLLQPFCRQFTVTLLSRIHFYELRKILGALHGKSLSIHLGRALPPSLLPFYFFARIIRSTGSLSRACACCACCARTYTYTHLHPHKHSLAHFWSGLIEPSVYVAQIFFFWPPLPHAARVTKSPDSSFSSSSSSATSSLSSSETFSLHIPPCTQQLGRWLGFHCSPETPFNSATLLVNYHPQSISHLGLNRFRASVLSGTFRAGQHPRHSVPSEIPRIAVACSATRLFPKPSAVAYHALDTTGSTLPELDNRPIDLDDDGQELQKALPQPVSLLDWTRYLCFWNQSSSFPTATL